MLPQGLPGSAPGHGLRVPRPDRPRLRRNTERNWPGHTCGAAAASTRRDRAAVARQNDSGEHSDDIVCSYVDLRLLETCRSELNDVRAGGRHHMPGDHGTPAQRRRWRPSLKNSAGDPVRRSGQ